VNDNWIGTWSPGIGDPSVGGWATVALYVGVAWACNRVLRAEREHILLLQNSERRIWQILMVSMVMLGLNKQLDLQSAMTEIARTMAVDQGWYEQRRRYQEAFIVAVPVVGVTAMAAFAVWVWTSPRLLPSATLLACAGATGLLVFIAVRAASFHHVDRMLGWKLGGLPLNWILELGSLAVIGLSALRRGRVNA
jgi:hypothetical protein